jgi:hypothetical protein
MTAGCSGGGFFRQELEWLLKLLERFPELTERIKTIWSKLSDSSTPAWQRGLILLALLEVIASLPVELPVILAIRLLVLMAFFRSEDSRRGQDSASAG